MAKIGEIKNVPNHQPDNDLIGKSSKTCGCSSIFHRYMLNYVKLPEVNVNYGIRNPEANCGGSIEVSDYHCLLIRG